MIKHAIRASNYISRREGDCIEKRSNLTSEHFNILFPDVNLSIFESEEELNVKVVDGIVLSTKPTVTYTCKAINFLEENPNITGPIVLLLTAAIIHAITAKLKKKDKEQAKELAKHAHKILATTDKQIYIYDMKVQLRAKNKRIDRLWKSVVKYIENDSHVIVGVMGARHEVYWKWIHHE